MERTKKFHLLMTTTLTSGKKLVAAVADDFERAGTATDAFCTQWLNYFADTKRYHTNAFMCWLNHRSGALDEMIGKQCTSKNKYFNPI